MEVKQPLVFSRRGSALVELIAGLAIFLLLQATFIPLWSGLLKVTETVKIDNACRMLAIDIGDLQRKALYNNLGGPQYILALDQYGDGYSIIKNQTTWKRVKFSEIGLKSVIVTCANTNLISFTANGTPKKSASVNVYCKENIAKRKIVEVQPVTGRIVIKDASA